MHIDHHRLVVIVIIIINSQGWGPRGLAATSRTPRGQNFVALALALASTMLSSNTSLVYKCAIMLAFKH